MLTKYTQHIPYLFCNEYKSVSKFYTNNNNKNLYSAHSEKNGKEYVIKQFIFENKEQALWVFKKVARTT